MRCQRFLSRFLSRFSLRIANRYTTDPTIAMEIAVQQLEMCFRQADSDLQHVANKLEIEFEQRCVFFLFFLFFLTIPAQV